MSAQHTQGPLAYRVLTRSIRIFSETTQAEVCSISLSPYIENSRRHADARRIVACVNACAGISTEQLEGSEKAALESVIAQRDEVIAQRDELAAALRNLVVMLPSDAPDAVPTDRVPAGFIYIRWQDLREARGALAKVTS